MKKIVLAAGLALVALFAVAATASGFSAEVRNAGEISTPSLGQVTFSAGEIAIACNLTLSGTLASAIANVETSAEQHLGSVEGVSWASCRGGEVSGALNTPWNIRYDSETGSLPNEVSRIGFTVQNAQFRLSVFGGFVNCLYAGEAPVSMAVTRTRAAGVYTSSTISTIESSFSKVSGSFCPASGNMTGQFSMSPTQTITVS